MLQAVIDTRRNAAIRIAVVFFIVVTSLYCSVGFAFGVVLFSDCLYYNPPVRNKKGINLESVWNPVKYMLIYP